MKIKHVFLAAILFSLSSLYANAATYTVTNTNNNGPGSLREAVVTANSTLADDLIVFNIPGCLNEVCRIVLGSKQAGAAQLFVNSSASAGTLTISNPSGPKRLIISADPLNRSRIFFTNVGSNLMLEGLTMEDGIGYNGGAGGGAIANFGSLTVSNSIIQNNDSGAGGGIYNSGSLTVSNSVIRNNQSYGGGGIYNSGTLTVIRSVISGNLAGSIGGPGFDLPAGGGILSRAGTLVILDSTIAGNDTVVGGGIFLGDPYTASFLTAVIANSTISGNTAYRCGAGIGTYLVSSSSVRITNSTITMNTVQASDGNGGALCGSGGNIFARNSVIAGNTAASFPNIDERLLVFNNLGNNLIGVSPLLWPLANNGGPTRTHALLTRSPAINAGNNCVLTANGCGDNNPALPNDQRGMSRNGTVDIGAFEQQQNLTSSTVPFDFDGDRRTDISVFRGSESNWYIFQSQTQSVRAQGWGLSSDRVAPADFDGDGKTDLAVFRESDSNWYIFNSLTNTATVFGWGLAGDLPVPADYNGDQKADIAVYRPAESNWYRKDSDGQIHVYAWGIAGDKPAPADFNGDGVADMTVFRPSEGKWFTINSGDASITESTWGINGDIPIPADYSGDGKADFCVFRPSDQTWYRIHSNDFTVHIITWGLPGDLPVPGDYDGDGRSDLAVFRPSSATWFLNTSTSGIYSQPFGLTGDKPTPNAFLY